MRKYQYRRGIDEDTGELFDVREEHVLKRDQREEERIEREPLKPYDLSKIECKEFFEEALKQHRKRLYNPKVKVDEKLLELLMNKDLHLGAIALLSYLARTLFYKNYTYLRIKDFVEEMEVSEATAYRLLGLLLDKRYIREVESKVPGKEAIIEMDPNIFYIGNEGMRSKSIQDWYSKSIGEV